MQLRDLLWGSRECENGEVVIRASHVHAVLRRNNVTDPVDEQENHEYMAVRPNFCH